MFHSLQRQCRLKAGRVTKSRSSRSFAVQWRSTSPSPRSRSRRTTRTVCSARCTIHHWGRSSGRGDNGSRPGPPYRAAWRCGPGRWCVQFCVKHRGWARWHVVLSRRHTKTLLDHAQLSLRFPAFSVFDFHLFRLAALELKLERNKHEFTRNKLVSQSCAVAKSEIFWRATGQSNLADRMEDCSIGQSAVVWVRKPNFGSFCCGQPFVCQVWLLSCPPECFTFSYCAWIDCTTGCWYETCRALRNRCNRRLKILLGTSLPRNFQHDVCFDSSPTYFLVNNYQEMPFCTNKKDVLTWTDTSMKAQVVKSNDER